MQILMLIAYWEGRACPNPVMFTDKARQNTECFQGFAKSAMFTACNAPMVLGKTQTPHNVNNVPLDSTGAG